MKHDPPNVRKAHDVRHLSQCPGCGEIGDDRKMIQTNADEFMHGDCAFKALGENILQLSSDERKKFTLGDVGVPMMRRLMSQAFCGMREQENETKTHH